MTEDELRSWIKKNINLDKCKAYTIPGIWNEDDGIISLEDQNVFVIANGCSSLQKVVAYDVEPSGYAGYSQVVAIGDLSNSSGEKWPRCREIQKIINLDSFFEDVFEGSEDDLC